MLAVLKSRKNTNRKSRWASRYNLTFSKNFNKNFTKGIQPLRAVAAFDATTNLVLGYTLKL